MARALFLGLLAFNLVLLGWHLTVDTRGQNLRASSVEPRAPLLSLVDEDARDATLPPDTDDSGDESTDGETALNGAARRCLSLGPFTDDAEFEAALLRLSAMGLVGAQRRAQGQIWVGYWIYLPSTGNREQAVALVEALRTKGVSDIYIEPAGERENAVSLGVFSERVRAQRRYREIRDLGFEPQIARRNRQGTVYWLDFVPDEKLRIDPGEFQVAPGRIIRLASRVCQQPDVQIE